MGISQTEMARLIAGLVAALLVGVAVSVTLPEEIYEVLDPINAVELSESSSQPFEQQDRTLEAMERNHRFEKLMSSPEESSRHSQEPVFHPGRHDDQMSDLFGDMVHQQQRENLEVQAGGAFALGASLRASDQNRGLRLVNVTAGQTVTPPDVSAQNQTNTQIRGNNELQSFSTGHITQTVQVGSDRGEQSEVNTGAGSLLLFGHSNGLYLERLGNTWSLFSDIDKQSGGVCIFSAYNNKRVGLKICHTHQQTGTWASGNVGLSGDLSIKNTQSKLTAGRLHLTQTDVSEGGAVLRAGGHDGTQSVTMGVSPTAAWLGAGARDFPLTINKAAGNVGVCTTKPQEKLHVKGDASVYKLFLGDEEASFSENRLLFAGGTGWEMTDKDYLKVVGNRGLRLKAGAFFGAPVGVGVNEKAKRPLGMLHVAGGKIGVTRDFGGVTKGIEYFYDDKMSEGVIQSKNFKKGTLTSLVIEGKALILNPDGKNPIAFGTRTPKPGYLVHVEGESKIEGQMYIAKKMKVDQKAHIENLHTPRLEVKNQDDGGAGKAPADEVQDFVIGEYTREGNLYSLRPGGTNLRMGYSPAYCWMQMWPKGHDGAALVLNAGGNSVGFGTIRPLTKLPGSGAEVKFHVDGDMLVTGNLAVKGPVSGRALMDETQVLLDVSAETTFSMLADLSVGTHSSGKQRFVENERHQGAVSISHIAAVLTKTLQYHQKSLDEMELELETHTSQLDELLSRHGVSV